MSVPSGALAVQRHSAAPLPFHSGWFYYAPQGRNGRLSGEARYGALVDTFTVDLAGATKLSTAFAGADVAVPVNSGPDLSALDRLRNPVADRREKLRDKRTMHAEPAMRLLEELRVLDAGGGTPAQETPLTRRTRVRNKLLVGQHHKRSRPVHRSPVRPHLNKVGST